MKKRQKGSWFQFILFPFFNNAGDKWFKAFVSIYKFSKYWTLNKYLKI